MRVLSGIQPTGRFHWGNYFGAIRQYIDLQNEDRAYYFIANLHALTTVRDPKQLNEWTMDAALDLLALGLNPDKAVLFVQSDVPEISELCWLLMTGAPMGLLERCVAYKDKKEKGIAADAGLFTYPVLMAADILAYDADTVPVGQDQLQHIEVCRDLAASFNHHFGQVFVMPKGKDPGSFCQGSRHRRRKDVEELQQHIRVVRRRQVATQEDHENRHRLPPDGVAKRSGDRSYFSVVLAGSYRCRAKRNGRTLSTWRVWLRRGEKITCRCRRAILRSASSQTPGTRGEPRPRARDPL